MIQVDFSSQEIEFTYKEKTHLSTQLTIKNSSETVIYYKVHASIIAVQANEAKILSIEARQRVYWSPSISYRRCYYSSRCNWASN